VTVSKTVVSAAHGRRHVNREGLLFLGDLSIAKVATFLLKMVTKVCFPGSLVAKSQIIYLRRLPDFEI